jgi:hypothetical protein
VPLRAADSYISHASVIPLATAGLFAFAVIGFVAVANRRKFEQWQRLALFKWVS